jgi:osmotically-inducible protein OsmY
VFANVLLLALAVTGPVQPDAQLLQLVSRAVHDYPHYTIFDDVTAAVESGVVTLTGKVTRPHKRTDLQRRVGGIKGVRAVRVNVAILPSSRADDALRDRVARAIYQNPSFRRYAVIPDPPIHIVVEDGHVRLTGVVHAEPDRALATALAGQCGALSVSNDLETVSRLRRTGAVPD